jgi:hypothetical protein
MQRELEMLSDDVWFVGDSAGKVKCGAGCELENNRPSAYAQSLTQMSTRALFPCCLITV